MNGAAIDLKKAAQEVTSRFPEKGRRAALLPLLHAAQERDGYVTGPGMQEIGEILGLTSAEVLSVATFYTMFHLEPKGEHVVGICHNMACALRGAEGIIAAVEEHLGVECGQRTPDGKITLERHECLAACDQAPMLQVDYDQMFGPLSPESAVELVTRISSGSDHWGPAEKSEAAS